MWNPTRISNFVQHVLNDLKTKDVCNTPMKWANILSFTFGPEVCPELEGELMTVDVSFLILDKMGKLDYMELEELADYANMELYDNKKLLEYAATFDEVPS